MLRPTVPSVLALIFLPLVICDKWPQLFDPQIQQNASSAPLTGRQLIRSWLGQRQLVCNNPATEGLCPDGSGCCLLTQSCCTNAYCADPGDVCCPSGTCGPNKGCCGELHCYPLGGECCADESYCDPGNHCYIYDGYQTCCTDSQCTARVTAGVTSTFYVAPTVAPVPTITQPPPVVTTSEVDYTYYYYTITWYYYSYYWIFTTIDEIDTPTTTVTTTSTYITTSSVTSVYETDSAAASSAILSISADFTPPTPVAATSLPPPPTVPAPTTTSSETSTSSKSSKTKSTVVTVTAPGSSSTSVANAASIRDLQTTGVWAVAVFFSFGVLLVWL